ncbi:tRNA (N(6)-L-threonylcarbamoyladenosine(37)-C(2))-methylthiotransferase [Halobacteria archaeon HArc-gm2]|nr:tRNA (N(6)-L-threonylcarbamoyladenosine(37)-C(2))-methylthiotransferase [Halobacteria archaeon HArc-gm2]
MARYHIETYGCTSNRGESRQIEQALRDGGHHPADGPESADVAILNTCTVVEKTERNMLRRAEELDEETPADLVITGCMALAQGEEFRNADIEADVLHWDDVPQHVLNGECPTVTPDTEPVLDGVVGILPIARGCMSDCSYCITKQATGRIESPPVEENLEKARALVHAGAKEIRITGQDTGVYGWDRNQGESLLPELLERICTEIDGEFRVRIGMANPKGIHGVREELADLFATHDELYSFLHAPVQSGSDDVLADMRRQHEVEEYVEVVETFDEYLDYWTLSTDFIVGFPTEDDRDFQQTMALLRETRPEKINVTRFSKRPGTDAADMKGLGGTVKKERSKAMSELKMDVVAEAYEAMVESDETREVLLVEDGTDESLVGYDGAYRQVVIADAEERGLELGEFVDCEITSHNTVYAFGEPVN